ncbi:MULTISPECIES: hypothetical protein [Rhodomicrobium]|uniref:hypothetical protein n=1 Tax=Rhodomicrobium TaxID=1068 RepID=UPI0015953B3D|nr:MULTISPECIES: hypothetical protein [Rhodomicrobium]
MAMFWAGPVYAESAEPLPPMPEKQFSAAETKAIADYRAAFGEYKRAREAHERKGDAYWERIEDKRAARRAKRAKGGVLELSDYVLDQPPAYSGPSEPKRPAFLPLPPAPKVKKKPPLRDLPVVADFLTQARLKFKFVPDKPKAEIDYKRAYARAAVAAGITKDQAVRIYGFEAGGNGEYDVQAGLEAKKKGSKPISTALGYNQLLVANSLGLLAEHGAAIGANLDKRAEGASPARRKALKVKGAALLRMVKYARSIPYRWAVHERVARTPKGWAVHALILDTDIGPLLQTQKLVNSLEYARRGGHTRPMSAAELELMNLTGDGNGFDMLTMPVAMRDKVPTSNFFQRGGYQRNPVASRNNTVASLIAAMDRRMDHNAGLDGAKQLAAAFQEVIASADPPPAAPPAPAEGARGNALTR